MKFQVLAEPKLTTIQTCITLQFNENGESAVKIIQVTHSSGTYQGFSYQRCSEEGRLQTKVKSKYSIFWLMQIKYLETKHINHQIINEKNEIPTAQRKTSCFFVKGENLVGLYILPTQLLMISRISSPVRGLENKIVTKQCHICFIKYYKKIKTHTYISSNLHIW